MLASALAFNLMGVCVKAVGSRLSVAEVVLARALVSVLLSWWLLRRRHLPIWGERKGMLILRGVIGTAALGCVYGALTHLPLASATVLQYLYPTFTALLAWLTLREHLAPQLLLAMALGWLGVLVVAQPSWLTGQASALPLLPLLLGVAGALLTALAYVSVRALGRSEHPLVIVFYFPLVAIPLTLPLVALQPVLPTASELLWLVGVGLFTQLGQIGLTKGLMALPAARATAMSYVQVVLAALWGWLFFAEHPNGWTVLGAALVLAATLLSLGAPPAGAGGRSASSG
ncbi:DMT family transporter [Cyanobium sp. Morenito 9A2]|nr:DMT family transporter [Cyanobium sp. Morenito 9A2]